jgi:hypothetical protein
VKSAKPEVSFPAPVTVIWLFVIWLSLTAQRNLQDWRRLSKETSALSGSTPPSCMRAKKVIAKADGMNARLRLALFAMMAPRARTGKVRIAASRYVGICRVVQGNVAGTAAMINITPAFIESLIVERRPDAERQAGRADEIHYLHRMRRKRPVDSRSGYRPRHIGVVVEVPFAVKRTLCKRVNRG